MTAWVWLDQQTALAIHERLLMQHGGAKGVCEMGLLDSALARPQQIGAYGDEPDAAILASAYTAGIVQNHPFIDGNNRTGFVLGILFLELNGLHFTASEEAATQAVFDLAAGVIGGASYAAFLRENSIQE